MNAKKEKFSQAVKRVYEKLSALSQDEFLRRLEKHVNGDIAGIIHETNALKIGQVKAEIYDRYTWASIDENAIPTSKDNCSLFFNLEESITVSISPHLNSNLFHDLEEKEIVFGDEYYLQGINLPDIQPMNFNQPYLWGTLFEEIYTLQMPLDRRFFIDNIQEVPIIAANEEKEYLKWAA